MSERDADEITGRPVRDGDVDGAVTPETAARSDAGPVRDCNEDAVLARELDGDAALVAVADGMGGHAAGDVASETAVEAFDEAVDAAVDAAGRALRRAVERANRAVHEAADSGVRTVGTTLVAAVVESDRATVANVGDSRAYHVGPETVERVTTDHTVTRQLLDADVIDEREARTHPQRHVLTQALGTTDALDVDVYETAREGPLLLCSDGLTEAVPEAAVPDIVDDAGSLGAAADRLVARAVENVASDNVSVVLAGEY